MSEKGPEGTKKPKVALVIGSGGVKCTAALGIYEKLEEENIEVDMVVGCSGGSIIGGFIVTGQSSEEATNQLKKMWVPDIVLQFRLKKMLKILFPKMMGFNERFGMTDESLMADTSRKLYGEKTTFKDTKIPFYCITTDIKNGETVVITRGNVADAVRMSSTIPVLFEPVEHEGKFLVDGGLSNPLPVDVAMKEGADIIIAVGFMLPRMPTLTNVGSFVNQMFRILTNELLSSQIAFYTLTHHSEILMIIPDFDEEIKLTDVHKIPMIIQKGKEEIQKHISYIRRLME